MPGVSPQRPSIAPERLASLGIANIFLTEVRPERSKRIENGNLVVGLRGKPVSFRNRLKAGLLPESQCVRQMKAFAWTARDWDNQAQFNLNPIFEDGDANLYSSLSIVGVDERVDNGFTKRYQWKFPNLGVFGSLDHEAPARVTLDELKRSLYREHWIIANIGRVKNGGFVPPFETACTDESVGKFLHPVLPEQNHAPNRGRLFVLMKRRELEVFQIGSLELPELSEALGSGSEVDCFRVFSRQRLFIKGTVAEQFSRFQKAECSQLIAINKRRRCGEQKILQGDSGHLL